MSEPLELETGATSVDVQVTSLPGTEGAIVRTDVARSFTSRHVEWFRAEVQKDDGREEITADIPNLPAEKTQHLDARGVVREGTRVRPGDILVGKVQLLDDATTLTPEEKLLRSIFGEKAGSVRDVSVRCSPEMKGEVTEVVLDQTGKGTEVRVQVTDLRPLRVGDVLSVDGEEVVVADIRDDAPGELVWGSARAGRLPTAKVRDAESVTHARSIGPYSLVTQQPLGGKAQFGGQRITEEQLRVLEGAGAWHVVQEMLTIKSDDVAGRARLYESIVRGQAKLDPGAPETREVLFREIRALGFEVAGVRKNEAKSEPMAGDIFSLFAKPTSADLDEVSIRLSTTESIVAASSGEVKKPETINYRTFKPERDGLFCARIFGPVKDYECLCGKYARMKHRGVVCEQCGVEVIQSRVRRERFGHLTLPLPVLHPLAYGALGKLFGRSEKDLRRIVSKHLGMDLQETSDWRSAGVNALREAAGSAGAPFFLDAWPVLPPDLRPLVPLGGGRFATSDLNDLYRRLINRRNRLARLIELNAPDKIIANEQVVLQHALESLVENGRSGKTVTGPNHRPLRPVMDLVESHLGGSPNVPSGKRVDYSACGVVVPHDLPEDVVLLPREIALEVFKPWIYSRLERLGYVTTIKSAKRLVEKRSEPVLDALETGVREHPVLIGPRHGAAFAGVRVRLWDELAIGVSAPLMATLGLTRRGRGDARAHDPRGNPGGPRAPGDDVATRRAALGMARRGCDRTGRSARALRRRTTGRRRPPPGPRGSEAARVARRSLGAEGRGHDLLVGRPRAASTRARAGGVPARLRSERGGARARRDHGGRPRPRGDPAHRRARTPHRSGAPQDEGLRSRLAEGGQDRPRVARPSPRHAYGLARAGASCGDPKRFASHGPPLGRDFPFSPGTSPCRRPLRRRRRLIVRGSFPPFAE